MNATREQWRPVVGYEGDYEVSNKGRVRSLDRTVVHNSGRTQRRKGRLLATILVLGYPRVNLTTPARGARAARIHVLVLEAFVGLRPDGMHGCHNDGDPTNNALSNLRWGTRSENMLDKRKHGTHHNAAKTHCNRGHPFDEANTYTDRHGGFRHCRACGRQLAAERRARSVGLRKVQPLTPQGEVPHVISRSIRGA